MPEIGGVSFTIVFAAGLSLCATDGADLSRVGRNREGWTLIGRALAAVTVVALAIVAVLFSTRPADAHALLIRSDPADGALLTTPPERVSGFFSEPLETAGSRLRVLSGSGDSVDDGQVQIHPPDPTTMSVGLTNTLVPGFYQVTWETLSRVDGHFWFGSFQFTVLNPDGSQPSGPRPGAITTTGSRPDVPEGSVTKAAGLIGIAVLVGGLAALLFVLLPAALAETGATREAALGMARRYANWILLPSIGLLAAVGVAEVYLQAHQLAGIDHLRQVLETDWGGRWLWRQLCLAAIGLLILVHFLVDLPYPRRYLSLAAALVVGLYYLLLVSLVSHANAVPAGAVWATVSDFIHVTTATAWIGGLLALALTFVWSRRTIDESSRPPLLAGALWRFSLLAGTSLVLLLATGVFNGLVQIPNWESLIDTAYGRALVVKLVLIVPLLVATGFNALVLRPRLIRKARSDPSQVERLRHLLVGSVGVEAGLAVAVLVVVGVLVQYTPARVELEATGAAQAATSPAISRDSFAYPLVTGNWSWVAAGVLILAALLIWVWSPCLRFKGRVPAWVTPAAMAVASLAALALIGTNFTASPSGSSAFTPAVGFRYQTTDGRLVLLEANPFRVGQNQFKVTSMTENGAPAEAKGVLLQFSRLERAGNADQVTASPADDGAYMATYNLSETGWWAIDVSLDGSSEATFYLRLDDPSQAPLSFAPPSYTSDPSAEQMFRNALSNFEALGAVKWREELTSGLLAPTGIGAWIVTDAQAATPSSIDYKVLSPGSSNYESVRVGEETCTQDAGGTWECTSGGEPESPFDREYMKPSTAFRLGRQEVVGGQKAQVVLLYNPSQPAWYAWWIDMNSGQVLRQAMVASGHFMLTTFYDQNVPVSIELPSAASATGG